MGIVHHSNYAIWFEAGRTDFIRKIGYPYSRIEKSGLKLPLIELRCVYKGSARYEDIVAIRTRLQEITPLRVHFVYFVYILRKSELQYREEILSISSDLKPICEGDTFHVWTDNSLKPVNIKKLNPELFDLLNSATNLRK